MAVSGAHDIPRVRRHEPSLIHGNSERLRHGPVRLGGRLEAPHRVHGERSLEERGETGVRELLLHRRRGGIRQRDQSESGVTHGLKTVSHIGVCGQGQHALENPSTIGRRERDTASRGRHVRRCTTGAREVRVRAGRCRHFRVEQDGSKLVLQDSAVAEDVLEMRFERPTGATALA